VSVEVPAADRIDPHARRARVFRCGTGTDHRHPESHHACWLTMTFRTAAADWTSYRDGASHIPCNSPQVSDCRTQLAVAPAGTASKEIAAPQVERDGMAEIVVVVDAQLQALRQPAGVQTALVVDEHHPPQERGLRPFRKRRQGVPLARGGVELLDEPLRGGA